jgi:hypothetical protein
MVAGKCRIGLLLEERNGMVEGMAERLNAKVGPLSQKGK